MLPAAFEKDEMRCYITHIEYLGNSKLSVFQVVHCFVLTLPERLRRLCHIRFTFLGGDCQGEDSKVADNTQDQGVKTFYIRNV